MVQVNYLETEYNVSEGNDVAICLMLDGAIDRNVVINISTQDIGSASGEDLSW